MLLALRFGLSERFLLCPFFPPLPTQATTFKHVVQVTFRGPQANFKTGVKVHDNTTIAEFKQAISDFFQIAVADFNIIWCGKVLDHEGFRTVVGEYDIPGSQSRGSPDVVAMVTAKGGGRSVKKDANNGKKSERILALQCRTGVLMRKSFTTDIAQKTKLAALNLQKDGTDMKQLVRSMNHQQCVGILKFAESRDKNADRFVLDLSAYMHPHVLQLDVHIKECTDAREIFNSAFYTKFSEVYMSGGGRIVVQDFLTDVEEQLERVNNQTAGNNNGVTEEEIEQEVRRRVAAIIAEHQAGQQHQPMQP